MRVLVLHDDAELRETIEGALARDGYENVLGAAATAQLDASWTPDLVLCGTNVPAHPSGVPVIVVTGDGSPEGRAQALTGGIDEVLVTPFSDEELRHRVRGLLQLRHLERELDTRDARLVEAMRRRTDDTDTARESLSILAAISEYHDDDNEEHAQRVGVLAGAIARALELSDEDIAMIREAAPLHDIGKIGISRRILLKPGKLTPNEWMHMMRHVEIGWQMLSSARSPALRLAAEIARTHHERWDGSGYMIGLAGGDIPLSGRITALADVWDTLTHQRPYKAAWEESRALEEIVSQSGRQFDPRVVSAFLTIDRRLLELEFAVPAQPAVESAQAA